MSYQVPSQETRDADFRKQLGIIRNISLFQNAGINVDYSGQGLGSRDTPTSVARGTSALDPIIHTLTKDASNLYHATIQAGTIIVQDVTQVGNILLHYIDQAGALLSSTLNQGIKGVWALVKGIAGRVLTLVKAVDTSGTQGNFYLDANITLNENQQVIMQWHSDLGTKGMWVVAGATPTISGSGFANQQLSNLVGPTAINADLNLVNHNIQQVRLLGFNSTGGLQNISTSGDGKVFDFTLNNLSNIFRMSDTNQGGIFEALSGSGSAPASLKVVNLFASLNQTLGTINFDGEVVTRASFVTLSGIISNLSSNGFGKFLVSTLQGGPVLPSFSVDASNGTVQCIGTKLTIYSTQNDPLPNGLPLTIDTLGSFAAYSNNGGHLFQNVGGGTFYFGAFKPNVFYQGIQMVTNARTNSSYTVDSTNGSGSDLIITMTDNTFTRNCTLPDANQFSGRFLIIKNLGSHSVFLVTVGGQTVDGQASGAYTLTGGTFASAILFASGGQWWVAGKV